MGKTKVFEIICGSYEEFLLGYNYSTTGQEFTQSFAAHDHASSVRCVAISDHYLASGGADDRIFIYDLRARKEHCSLTHHNATVNCLQFTNNHSHLISGSADGVLAIVRVGNWQLEKIWDKAHKGAAILDIAVHTSGKLALSLGADHTLSTWNLIKGRQAYVINLNSKCKDPKSLEKIIWCDDAIRFILYGGKYTEIWSIESGGVLQQIEHNEKVISCFWFSNDSILVGHENGELSLVNIETDDRRIVKGHGSRVKSVALYRKWIISTSSSGEIKIWNKDLNELAKFDTGCRLTCLCIVPPTYVKAEAEGKEIEEVEVTHVHNTKRTPTAKVVETMGDSDEEEYKVVKRKKKEQKRGKQKKNKSVK